MAHTVISVHEAFEFRIILTPGARKCCKVAHWAPVSCKDYICNSRKYKLNLKFPTIITAHGESGAITVLWKRVQDLPSPAGVLLTPQSSPMKPKGISI